jgi:hypothetical protein
LLEHQLGLAVVAAASTHADRGFVTGAFRAGAAGFLFKDSPAEHLHVSVKTVETHPYSIEFRPHPPSKEERHVINRRNCAWNDANDREERV